MTTNSVIKWAKKHNLRASRQVIPFSLLSDFLFHTSYPMPISYCYLAALLCYISTTLLRPPNNVFQQKTLGRCFLKLLLFLSSLLKPPSASLTSNDTISWILVFNLYTPRDFLSKNTYQQQNNAPWSSHEQNREKRKVDLQHQYIVWDHGTKPGSITVTCLF